MQINVKKTKRKKRFLSFFFALIFAFGLVVFYYNATILPIVDTMSQEKMRALTVTAVNNAVSEVINASPSSTNMLKIYYDNDKTISSIVINSVAVNKIVKDLTAKVSTNLENMKEYGIDIPIGSFTGIVFLSGLGPSVNLRVLPVASVTPKLFSEFKEMGINQTHHRLYVKLNTSVSVVLPGANNIMQTITEISLSESIIVGKIPDTYLNSTSTEDMMDLIP
ncbi:MAG: sporulation protein YunB [Clostridia bacterium]|nr:sporulation protein YunB [Clostridia bacterium]